MNSGAAERFNIAQLDSVVQSIYNFDFDKARDLTRHSSASEKYKVLPFAYAHYWEFLSGNEPGFNIKTCSNYLHNKTIPQKGDTLQEVYQVSVNLLQLRVHISRANYIAPLLLFDDVGRFFKSYCPDSTSDFNMLYWGLYNYYITYARENSFASRFILNDWPESSKKSGIAMLEKLVTSRSAFVKTEATYFLIRIYLESEKDYTKAIGYASELTYLYPENYIYKWFYLRALKAHGELELFDAKRAQYIKELSHSDLRTDQQKVHFNKLFKDLDEI